MMAEASEPNESGAGVGPEGVDLRDVPIDRVLEQVAQELAMLAAAHMGLLPGTQDGRGDGAAARMALDAGSGLVEVLLSSGAGPGLDELRRTYAELMLAYAQSAPVGDDDPDAAPPTGQAPPAEQAPPPPPPRPSIWTPGGEV